MRPPTVPPALRWQPAASFRQRLVGLLGRPRPAPASALLLRPCRAVHTAGMAYPIDVVFIARSGRVVRVCPQVGPWRIRLCRHAYAVAELAAGEAARLGIAAGSRLRLPP